MTISQIIERFQQNALAHKIGLNNEILNACLNEWTRPHRFYHGLNHLSYLLEEIASLGEFSWEKIDKEKMEILALWHDVIYDPREKGNEDRSMRWLIQNFGTFNHPEAEEIFGGIHYTKYDKKHDFLQLPHDCFIKIFCILDIGESCSEGGETISNMVKREKLLLKEFQFVDYLTYKSKRVDFVKNFPYFNDKHITLDFLANYRPKIGVYPGSFLPFHIGQMNILEQAEKIFDKVIIANGINPDKNAQKSPWLTISTLPFHEVVFYDGLLSDYLKTLDYADVTVIRGLRSGYDLDYEMNQLRILEDYGCTLPVAYFLCSKETSHISSSMIRGLVKIPNCDVKKYIPTKYNYAN